ncbi:hypothetical protein C8R43DRAFT_1123474 [Mycena crocata]|nr:hypothetical protein C8R43DRAFT_1123474 [Mycena crocata]
MLLDNTLSTLPLLTWITSFFRPSAEWSNFNNSIGGRLIRTVPIAQPCHNPTYDASRCSEVRDSWHSSALHLSCDPSTNPDDQCVLGTYVYYAVNVSRPVHVYKTPDFVKKHNIWFVVRNTGHDANGLAIWTHFLRKTLCIEDFVSPLYRGVAVKPQAAAFDVAIRPSLRAAGNPVNAVLPAWRDAERLFIPMLPWDNHASW